METRLERRAPAVVGSGRLPPQAIPRLPPQAIPRLLAGPSTSDLAGHVDLWGPLVVPADLVAEVGRAGLGGRGGAGFPTAVKMAAVRKSDTGRRHRPVVVANGCEGEPASAKDRTLLWHSPHLVIDGMLAAAQALRADRAILCIKEGSGDLQAFLAQALAERSGRVDLSLVTVPARYVASQESALVNWLTHHQALPSVTPPRPAERGVEHRPTLVDNVETLADVALIARFGASWWRQLGTDDEPGTTLVTVSGGVRRPGVQEVAVGDRLADVLSAAEAGAASGVLVGGYFGTWLTPGQARVARLSKAGLAPFHAGVGCGVVAVMPEGVCPLHEVARVTRWLAGQSAGQCGPCRHGLPALAGAWDHLAAGEEVGRAADDVERWSTMVRGRGACGLPDGAASFASSARRVFADHIAIHDADGRCPDLTATQVLPLPGSDHPAGSRRGR